MSLETGTTENDIFYNYVGDDEFLGLEGNDLVEYGASTEDFYYSGPDRDTLDGGGGNDTLYGGFDDDQLLGGAGNDLLDGGSDAQLAIYVGEDPYNYYPIYEYITVYGGNDTLDGGEGADTLDGGSGDDFYRVDNVGDVVREWAGQGVDTVETGLSYTLGNHVENLALTGVAHVNGTGNSLNNRITGNDGDNLLDGGDGDDWLNGGLGRDALTGGRGNDNYVLDDSLDTLTELADEGVDVVWAGIDYTLTVNIEQLWLTGPAVIGSGNAQANRITGNTLDNSLFGLEGNDSLDGGEGVDSLAGGRGDDEYHVDRPADVIIELYNQGTDSVYANSSFSLAGGLENLILVDGGDFNASGNNLHNLIQGNSGTNLLRGGGGNDTMDGGAGTDRFLGGAGDDLFIIESPLEQVTEYSGEGNDTIRTLASYTLSEFLENIELTGVLNSEATGNAAANRLSGNSGHNLLDGGAGADTLTGGLGDDLYRVDEAGDVVTELAGQGTDTVETSVSLTLGANLENLVLLGGEALNGAGNALDNRLTGNYSTNKLSGGDGNDFFMATSGNDTLEGGNGTDTVSYLGTNRELVVDLTAGYAANGVFVQSLSGIENVTGTQFNDQLKGNTGNNTFIGNAGNDTITGGGGFDTVSYENAGSQIVTVNLTFRGDFGADIQAYGSGHPLLVGMDLLYGISGVTGSNQSDSITGSHAANRLSGGKGDDYISGGEGYYDTYWYYDGYDYYEEVAYYADGNDTLEGGEGNDTLIGGDGVDTASYARASGAVDVNLTFGMSTGADGADRLSAIEYLVGSTFSDTLTGDATSNRLDGGSGEDTLFGQNGNDTLLGGQGNDMMVGGEGFDRLEGGDGDDTLTGNSGDDALLGGAGADILVGGAGNDSYELDQAGDMVIEKPGEGIDTVSSRISYTLGEALENLALLGTAGIRGTGNSANNLIQGNNGNNILDGGLGNDTLEGGLGNDIYEIDSAADVIREYYGYGIDTVRAALSYSLSNSLEYLVLTGSGNTNGTGNELSNQLTGNAGDNILDGKAGSDIMQGGYGNDTYYVDNIYDSVIEIWAQGIDTVISSVRYDGVGRDIENIILTGNDSLDAIGNPLANRIDGNSGNNTLDGGLGRDTLAGGGGDDVYIIDNLLDVIVELADQGTDLVRSAVSFSLTGTELEHLQLTGTRNINATGNAGDNRLTGNSGNNRLEGSGGRDTLEGGDGNDSYVVDSADLTVIIEAESQGFDSVSTTTDYTLGNNLEQLILTGSDDLAGTGNTLDNVLAGNSGNNILNGRAGADTMKGGLGDDRYAVDNALDVVVEWRDAGTDHVFSSVSFSLDGSYAENLSLNGLADIDASGNFLDNILTGNSGNNRLEGKNGNDILRGGAGNDTYVFGIGNGIDTIADSDSTAGNTDVLQFQSGIAADQLWLRRVGNHLEISIIGRGDSVTIQDWYAGQHRHVEQIRLAGSGETLLDSDVANLVNAMATLTPPPAGQTTLNAAQHAQLDAVIAASWN